MAGVKTKRAGAAKAPVWTVTDCTECGKVIDQRNRSDRSANGFSNDDKIAERSATATVLRRASHSRGAEFDHLVPEISIEPKRLGRAGHCGWSFIAEEPIKQFCDGFLVGTESQINAHTSVTPAVAASLAQR